MRRIAIVGIAIEPPSVPRRGLSDVVAAAVAPAARLVAKLAVGVGEQDRVIY